MFLCNGLKACTKIIVIQTIKCSNFMTTLNTLQDYYFFKCFKLGKAIANKIMITPIHWFKYTDSFK